MAQKIKGEVSREFGVILKTKIAFVFTETENITVQWCDQLPQTVLKLWMTVSSS